VGGPGTLGQSLGSVAGNGNIYLIGVLTGFGPPSESLFPALARNATLHGIYVGSRADFEAMNAFLAEHRLKPIIDEIYPFEAATQAFEHLESGRHFGKIVIKVRG
jgi:NADPH:quinone reductase-like Zn-dependent oxidoreductase